MTETLSDGIYGPKDQDEQRRAFVLEMLAPGALDLNAYEVATKARGDRPLAKDWKCSKGRKADETQGKDSTDPVLRDTCEESARSSFG